MLHLRPHYPRNWQWWSTSITQALHASQWLAMLITVGAGPPRGFLPPARPICVGSQTAEVLTARRSHRQEPHSLGPSPLLRTARRCRPAPETTQLLYSHSISMAPDLT